LRIWSLNTEKEEYQTFSSRGAVALLLKSRASLSGRKEAHQEQHGRSSPWQRSQHYMKIPFLPPSTLHRPVPLLLPADSNAKNHRLIFTFLFRKSSQCSLTEAPSVVEAAGFRQPGAGQRAPGGLRGAGPVDGDNPLRPAKSRLA